MILGWHHSFPRGCVVTGTWISFVLSSSQNSLATPSVGNSSAMSDARGKGKGGVKAAPRHAELAVNLAGSTALFLLATWEAKNGD